MFQESLTLALIGRIPFPLAHSWQP